MILYNIFLLSWDVMNFPICIIPRTNSNASKPIIEVFDDAINSLQEIGMKLNFRKI